MRQMEKLSEPNTTGVRNKVILKNLSCEEERLSMAYTGLKKSGGSAVVCGVTIRTVATSRNRAKCCTNVILQRQMISSLYLMFKIKRLGELRAYVLGLSWVDHICAQQKDKNAVSFRLSVTRCRVLHQSGCK